MIDRVAEDGDDKVSFEQIMSMENFSERDGKEKEWLSDNSKNNWKRSKKIKFNPNFRE